MEQLNGLQKIQNSLQEANLEPTKTVQYWILT